MIKKIARDARKNQISLSCSRFPVSPGGGTPPLHSTLYFLLTTPCPGRRDAAPTSYSLLSTLYLLRVPGGGTPPLHSALYCLLSTCSVSRAAERRPYILLSTHAACILLFTGSYDIIRYDDILYISSARQSSKNIRKVTGDIL